MLPVHMAVEEDNARAEIARAKKLTEQKDNTESLLDESVEFLEQFLKDHGSGGTYGARLNGLVIRIRAHRSGVSVTQDFQPE